MGYWPAVMQAIKNADVVIVVVDARMPIISRNKDIEKKIASVNKEFLLVFNKVDLISKENLLELQKKNNNCYFISTINRYGIKNLRLRLQILTKSLKLDTLEVGIIGYPNVGKSALTNILTRAGKAKVSSKAGTTTGLQWVGGTKLKILDSPGVIPFEDDEVKLGILGAKNPEKLKDSEKVALNIIKLFMKNSIRKLEYFYGFSVEDEDDEYDIFEKIGVARKLMKKGGVFDDKRTALVIIKDWQTGKVKLE